MQRGSFFIVEVVVEVVTLDGGMPPTGFTYTTLPSGQSVGSSSTRRPLWAWARRGCIARELASQLG
jgi:porphobilinogen deaminase